MSPTDCGCSFIQLLESIVSLYGCDKRGPFRSIRLGENNIDDPALLFSPAPLEDNRKLLGVFKVWETVSDLSFHRH